MKKTNIESAKILFENTTLGEMYISQVESYLRHVNKIAADWNELQLGHFSIDDYAHLDRPDFFEKKYMDFISKKIKGMNLPDGVTSKLVKETEFPEVLKRLRDKNLDYRNFKYRCQQLSSYGGIRDYEIRKEFLTFENGHVFLSPENREEILNTYFRIIETPETKELYDSIKNCMNALDEVTGNLLSRNMINVTHNPVISQGSLFSINNEGKAEMNWALLLP